MIYSPPGNYNPLGYEQDADGSWHLLSFGKRSSGFRPKSSEQECQEAIRSLGCEQADADADERRFNVQ